MAFLIYFNEKFNFYFLFFGLTILLVVTLIDIAACTRGQTARQITAI
jgi:Tfp pilus assembly protein PilX